MDKDLFIKTENDNVGESSEPHTNIVAEDKNAIFIKEEKEFLFEEESAQEDSIKKEYDHFTDHEQDILSVKKESDNQKWNTTGPPLFSAEDSTAPVGDKRNFQTHKKTPSEERRFKCNICSFAAGWKGNLKRHMKIHTGEKPFHCPFCSFAAAHRANLQRHIRIHTGERPFKCELCSFAATRKGNLQIHMRTHTREKPYKCDICYYAAAENKTLQNHIKTHTGEKPYKCNLCSFGAVRKIGLQKHMKKHITVQLDQSVQPEQPIQPLDNSYS